MYLGEVVSGEQLALPPQTTSGGTTRDRAVTAGTGADPPALQPLSTAPCSGPPCLLRTLLHASVFPPLVTLRVSADEFLELD